MAQSLYQKQLDDFLNLLEQKQSSDTASFVKPSLLLHACCGPCSSYVLEYLSQHFDITVFYYNPNIYPEQEYHRRLNELKAFYTKFAPAAGVTVVEETYNPDDFYKAIQIHEHPERANEPEKGERCRLCYKFRLERAYEYAVAYHYDKYKEQIEGYSKQGYRVLVFGTYPDELDGKKLTKKITPMAFVMLSNPIRDKAKETFQYFYEQKVEIKVISGDNPVTVSEISKAAGIHNAEKYKSRWFAISFL